VRLLRVLRIATTTVAAAATGMINRAMGRGESHPVQLKAGDPAPDFALLGSDGRCYRLSDLRGRDAVVIAWFPKAFTPGCTKECESLGSSRAVLGQFKVRYFGASVDTPETNRRFAASLGIEYPVLSDPDRTVARAYGVIGASGFPSRWTFYIGTDGRILEIDKHVQAATHGKDVAARLTELAVPRQV
jgi:thioredoxin-dependent peroxiredoxin